MKISNNYTRGTNLKPLLPVALKCNLSMRICYLDSAAFGLDLCRWVISSFFLLASRTSFNCGLSHFTIEWFAHAYMHWTPAARGYWLAEWKCMLWYPLFFLSTIFLSCFDKHWHSSSSSWAPTKQQVANCGYLQLKDDSDRKVMCHSEVIQFRLCDEILVLNRQTLVQIKLGFGQYPDPESANWV